MNSSRSPNKSTNLQGWDPPTAASYENEHERSSEEDSRNADRGTEDSNGIIEGGLGDAVTVRRLYSILACALELRDNYAFIFLFERESQPGLA
jgi:hypothetical protein